MSSAAPIRPGAEPRPSLTRIASPSGNSSVMRGPWVPSGSQRSRIAARADPALQDAPSSRAVRTAPRSSALVLRIRSPPIHTSSRPPATARAHPPSAHPPQASVSSGRKSSRSTRRARAIGRAARSLTSRRTDDSPVPGPESAAYSRRRACVFRCSEKSSWFRDSASAPKGDARVAPARHEIRVMQADAESPGSADGTGPDASSKGRHAPSVEAVPKASGLASRSSNAPQASGVGAAALHSRKAATALIASTDPQRRG